MANPIMIRETTKSDLSDILAIHRAAFGEDEVVDLTEALLADASATPLLSLIAQAEDRPSGHILFTAARIRDPDFAGKVKILAPLGVVPDSQGQGLGGELIKAGIERLSEAGADLVFVLGYPDYYTRHGFEPAFPHNLVPPYPIQQKNHPAWMVQALKPGLLGTITGTIVAANALMAPEYWQE